MVFECPHDERRVNLVCGYIHAIVVIKTIQCEELLAHNERCRQPIILYHRLYSIGGIVSYVP